MIQISCGASNPLFFFFFETAFFWAKTFLEIFCIWSSTPGVAVVAVSLAIGAAIRKTPRFQTMDLSQDGVVSKEEFLQLCQDPTIKSYMTSLDSWIQNLRMCVGYHGCPGILKHGGRKCSSIHSGCHGCLRSVRHGCMSTYIVKTTNICWSRSTLLKVDAKQCL